GRVCLGTVSTSANDEEQQLQEEEDESDFDSALTVTEAYDLLDDAMRLLDGRIQQLNQLKTD
ncbi:unnamed protein product, partial [Rotaria socialis]